MTYFDYCALQILLLTYWGSDHFPIRIQSYTTAPPVTNGSWKLSKPDRTTFSSKASSDLVQNYSNDPIEHVTDILTNIVPKPGKDTSDPSNYRPIALTSCICKVMERMINSRLVWYLERNKLLSYAMRFPQTTQHYQSSGTTRIFCQRSFHSVSTCTRYTGGPKFFLDAPLAKTPANFGPKRCFW